MLLPMEKKTRPWESLTIDPIVLVPEDAWYDASEFSLIRPTGGGLHFDDTGRDGLDP